MPQISFNLKTHPSDFIVEEISPEKEVLALGKFYSFDEASKGKFLYFILQKENRDTLEVLDEIARQLHMSREVLSIAGMKDKSAITSQLASAYRVKKEQLDKIKIRGVKLIPIGYSDRKVFLGKLRGNRFTIAVRAVSKTPAELREYIGARIREMNGVFPNYFGEQRFGADKSTQKIGRLILKRDLKAAAKECAKRYRECAAFLERHPENYVGAIKQLPPNLQKMFIHAVQSEIFNRTLDELVARKLWDKNIEIPLPGYQFSSRIFTSGIDVLVETILKKEGISPKDFDINELPDISSAGESRRAFEEFHNFKILAIEKDSMNKGKLNVVLQVSLPKAAYATVFLAAVFRQ